MSRFRLALRITIRDIARHPWRSLLGIFLIALPVAASTLVITVATSERLTEEDVKNNFGLAQARLTTDSRDSFDNGGRSADGKNLLDSLPAQSEMVPVQIQWAIVQSKSGNPGSTLTLAESRWDSVQLEPSGLVGSMPTEPGQIVLTQWAAAQAGLKIGDTARVTAIIAGPNGQPQTAKPSLPLTVVGTLSNTGWYENTQGYVAAGQFPKPGAVPRNAPYEHNTRSWYVLGSIPLEKYEIQELRTLGISAVTRQAVAQVAAPKEGIDLGVSLATAAIIVVLAVMELVLLISPVFMVAAQRALRTLGLLAANGASHRVLQLAMLSGGALLGGGGAFLGIPTGILAAYALLPRLFGPTYQIAPPWLVLGLVGLGAVGLGVLSAYLPARRVARIEPRQALSGYFEQPELRRPGRVPLCVAIALFCGSAAAAVGVYRGGLGPLSSEILIALTVAFLLIGLVTLSGTTLRIGSTAFGRLSVTARIASRDSVRRRSRTVPTVAALTIAISGAVYTLAILTSASGNFRPDQPVERGDIWLSSNPNSLSATTVSEELFTAAIAETISTFDARSVALVRGIDGTARPPESRLDPAAGPLVVSPSRVVEPPEYASGSSLPTKEGVIIAEGNLLRMLTVQSPDQRAQLDLAAEILDAGGAVTNNPGLPQGGEASFQAGYQPLWDYDGEPLSSNPKSTLLSEITVRTVVAPLPGNISTVLSPAAARALEVATVPAGALIRPPAAPNPISASRFTSQFDTRTSSPQKSAYPGITAEIAVPSLSTIAFPLLLVLVACAVSAAAAAMVVALSAAETIPDLRTMWAIGAPRGKLRRFGCWQGALIGLTAMVPGLLGGMAISAIPLLQNRSDLHQLLGAPSWWWGLSLLAVAIPAVCALSGLLFSPRSIENLGRRL